MRNDFELIGQALIRGWNFAAVAWSTPALVSLLLFA